MLIFFVSHYSSPLECFHVTGFSTNSTEKARNFNLCALFSTNVTKTKLNKKNKKTEKLNCCNLAGKLKVNL